MEADRIITAGVNNRFTVQVTRNNQGIAGQIVRLNLQRLSDNKWWSGSVWGVSSTDLSCTETGTDYPGEYYYDIVGAEIQDGVTYIEQFKITSGIYAFNAVERLYGQYDIDKLSLQYDFSTYSKAVILWYDVDRPFGAATPIYWTYVYDPAGGNPTITSQIAMRDKIIRWTDATPV